MASVSDDPTGGGDATTLPAGWTLPRLRVTRDGDWLDGDVPITHTGILANLRATLRRDADGYFIQTRVRIPVEVEDVPFVVERVERRGEGLHAWLNDGTDGPMDPATLRVTVGNVPYGTVKGGAFEARLSRAATFQLLALAEADDRSGETVLRLGHRAFPLRRAS
jgi:hypothetical protein